MERETHTSTCFNFNQLIFTEGITNVHTKVHGFGLTLSGSVLSWFQTLKPKVLYDFDVLVKWFIESHTKIGIKHNTVTLILNIKQGDRERVRQSIDRMKQYIAQCPESKLPKQEHLVSCFLEGLRDADLYLFLFSQDHKDFEVYCFKSQHLDDSRRGHSSIEEHKSDDSSNARKNEELVSNRIVDRIVRLLKQDNPLGKQYRPYQPTPPLRDTPEEALKWREPCRRWGNHSTNECYIRQCYMREIGATMPTNSNPAHAQQNLGASKGAKRVLGAKQTPPRTTPFRYVREAEDSRPSMELVPSRPYYDDDSASMQLAISQLADLDTSIVQLPATSFVHVS